MNDGMVFFDTEVGVDDKKIRDIGAVRSDGAVCHCTSESEFLSFCIGAAFLCGHNVIHHDLKYLKNIPDGVCFIDTLYLSPLLFPKRPYHALVKDDKITTDELNNPVNDNRKAQELFYDEVNAFFALPADEKSIYYLLLHNVREFYGFFRYVDFSPVCFDAVSLIRHIHRIIEAIAVHIAPEHALTC